MFWQELPMTEQRLWIGVERLREDGELSYWIENRRHRRYAVDAVVEVVVADASMLFRGSVLDVSLAGCYVETKAQLRLKPGTRVSLVFWLNGKAFRPEATSRKVRPGRGVGFLFEPGDVRTRGQLEALIGEMGLEL
jgi:hypothetical protein